VYEYYIPCVLLTDDASHETRCSAV